MAKFEEFGFFLLLLLSIGGNGMSLKQLGSYEIITINERRISKRSIEDDDKSILLVHLANQSFHIDVKPARGVLSSSFSTILKYQNGSEERTTINYNDILHGYVQGCFRSWVRLARIENSAFIGSFWCDGQHVYIEPRILHENLASPNEVIVYRASDVILSENLGELAKHLREIDYAEPDQLEIKRKRRDTEKVEHVEKNRCELRIVADYSFFSRAGNKQLPFTSRYIVNLFDRVNQIYTKTDFGQDSSGKRLINLGFTIKEIIIFDSYSTDLAHYNANRDFNATEILSAFNERESSINFCLVHLLTARSFPGGALGLAYVASPGPGAGICPQTTHGYNTLFSSVSATAGGQLLVTREADIVTAHELGHSWGAQHDKDQVCQPKEQRDGNFIMHPYAVSGYDINNVHFSNCSITFMRKVLSNRAEDCFVPQQTAVCGNGILEVGEQCDEGFIVPGKQDGRCCSRECRFYAGALCSPRNHPCCSPACSFLPRAHICRHANRLQCSMQSNCTGLSGDCPNPRPTPDGSTCVDDGECQNGVCLPFCESSKIKKKACICPDEENACRRCCRESNSTQCLPEIRGGLLRDGTFCIHGTCKQAKCIREVVDVVSHFWGVLEGVDGSNWKLFLKSNIAAFIVFFSLVIWVPISFIVCKSDSQPPAERAITKVELRNGGL